jgi:predicted nucleotidyltransferase
MPSTSQVLSKANNTCTLFLAKLATKTKRPKSKPCYNLFMDNPTSKIIPILQKYGIKKAAYFGSYARGSNTKNSDLDILVDCPSEMDLLDLIGCEQEIEDILKIEIDLITYKGLSPIIEKQVLQEQKVFYAIQ